MGQKIVLFLILAAIALAGCAGGPAPVVNAGPSDPDLPRPPVTLQTDMTEIPAWEFGVCSSDQECMPTGCGAAMCGSEATPAVCATSVVGECLSTVPQRQCGCVQGVCRWERSVEVMQCAHRAQTRPETRPFTGFDHGDWYPSSPHHR